MYADDAPKFQMKTYRKIFGPKASTGPTMSALASSRRNTVEASAPGVYGFASILGHPAKHVTDPAQMGYGFAEPKQHDDDSDESNDEDGWVEEPDSDEEQLSFKSFCDSTCFKTLEDMASYDNRKYGFNLPKLLFDCGLFPFPLIRSLRLILQGSTRRLRLSRRSISYAHAKRTISRTYRQHSSIASKTKLQTQKSTSNL